MTKRAEMEVRRKAVGSHKGRCDNSGTEGMWKWKTGDEDVWTGSSVSLSFSLLVSVAALCRQGEERCRRERCAIPVGIHNRIRVIIQVTEYTVTHFDIFFDAPMCDVKKKEEEADR